jgi:hypothetical protein
MVKAGVVGIVMIIVACIGWSGIPSEQDAENVRRRRARIPQRLTVRREYDSPRRSLRPCWTAFVRILRGILLPIRRMR